MTTIKDYLNNILKAVFGKDVRQSIHDAIEQCYKDATGHPESVAAVVQQNEDMAELLDNTPYVEYSEGKPDDLPLNYMPVGSIYMSTVLVDPAKLFGGTWERFGNGRVLVGADEGDPDFVIGKTGGEKTHTLTSDEMPSHTHTYTSNALSILQNFSAEGSAEGSVVLPLLETKQTDSAGGGKAHNNLQPYVTCYMWTRVK